MPVSLGTFIRERRQALDLTQEELAERVGESVRQSEISRLEHDRVILPRRDRMEALAAALEVSIGELLLRTGWMDKDLFGESDEEGADALAEEDLHDVLMPKELNDLSLPELVLLLERIGEAEDEVTALDGARMIVGEKSDEDSRTVSETVVFETVRQSSAPSPHPSRAVSRLTRADTPVA